MAQAATFPPLETMTKPNLTTAEAAFYLGLKPQTLRLHACKQTGPLRPIRFCNRLHWNRAAVAALVGVTQ